MTGAPRVTVLGSVNMDLVTTTAHLPAPGETVLGTGFRTGSGGKGANQAVAAARAGAQVVFLGAVGDDAFAPALRRGLVEAGVDVALLRTVPGPSGVAAITVDRAGENSIVVVGGANRTVDALTDAERAAVVDADVLLCQLELPVTVVAEAIAVAHRSGTVTVLNAAPAQPLPDTLLTEVDVLVVNETEAAQLGEHALTRAGNVVTTLGRRGARRRGPDGTALHVPAPAVTVVDTTGAGDAFTGTLAACWHRGPEIAVRRAVAAGSLATTRPGAATAPTASEVDTLLTRLAAPQSSAQPVHPA
ncbi:ribokinase [Rhodococcus olei]|uniref:Ribokinase n=1 Tax=Rhodococcus olei TaxID=2161675 RepID=A0ABP8NZA7_9NOCA